MTSPLRRKHPTTAPATGWRSSTEWRRLAVSFAILIAALFAQLSRAGADSVNSGAPAGASGWSARNQKSRAAVAKPAATGSGLKWRGEASNRDSKTRRTGHAVLLGAKQEELPSSAVKPTADVEGITDREGPALAPPQIRRAIREVEGNETQDEIRLLSFTTPSDDPFTDPFQDEMADDNGDDGEQVGLEEEDAAFDADEMAQYVSLETEDESDLSDDEESDMPSQAPSLGEEYAQAGPTEPERCPSPRDLKPINQIDYHIAAEPGNFPNECALSDEAFQPRRFERIDFTWKASALCHKPLYFQQPKLERYGHTFGPVLTPIISVGHFFVSVPFLPYNMGMEPPWECVYALGWYRPGSCAPYTLGPVPLSVRGAITQGVVTTGLWFLFP